MKSDSPTLIFRFFKEEKYDIFEIETFDLLSILDKKISRNLDIIYTEEGLLLTLNLISGDLYFSEIIESKIDIYNILCEISGHHKVIHLSNDPRHKITEDLDIMKHIKLTHTRKFKNKH